MEKLVYVVWKDSGLSTGDFKRRMLGETSRVITELGAQKLTMNLVDGDVEYALGKRITAMENPIAGTISVWMHTALDRGAIEEIIARSVARYYGYLVSESVPIVNTTQTAPLGERTPGVKTIAFLQKPDRLTYEEWLDLWQGHHTRVAIETQSTFLYIQNIVIRPVTDDALPWTAIVEESFPAEAMTDEMAFYDAGGSEIKLEENRNRMMESCLRFIDFEQLESHIFSEYVLKPCEERANPEK